jgi:hypothetical protein
MCWATFWAIFLQTQLVTLLSMSFLLDKTSFFSAQNSSFSSPPYYYGHKNLLSIFPSS